MDPEGGCPSEDDVLAWLSGFTEGDAARALEEHVLGCRACTAVVAQAARAMVSGPARALPDDGSEATEPAPGDKLGRYIVLEPIGRGAMALVLLVGQLELAPAARVAGRGRRGRARAGRGLHREGPWPPRQERRRRG